MFAKLFTYLKFLTKSTNEHGVHSPFVYNYITKCIYTKPKKSLNKTLDVLLKSSSYFNFKKIKIVGNLDLDKELKNTLSNQSSLVKNNEILYFESVKNIPIEQFFLKFKLTNNSLIIINHIHKTHIEHRLWLKLIEFKEITVSIDMYYCGVLFLRKEQEKEHFTIRI